MRILFFGIDGATWQVARPLIQRGQLPALAELMERGSHTSLLTESEMPTSAAVWTTIATGKRPAKHGVHFFGATSRTVRVKRIWDILQGLGWRVGLCGYLVTWPPTEVDGFLIPDLFALGSETFPPDYRFLQNLALGEKAGKNSTWRSMLHSGWESLRHGLGINSLAHIACFLVNTRIRNWDSDERFWRKLLLQPRIFADVFCKLLKQYSPDFASFHFHPTDTLSHRYWKYWDPEPFSDLDPVKTLQLNDVIPQAYREADRILGRLMRQVGSDTLIVVTSDHGFQPLPEGQYKYDLRATSLLQKLNVETTTVPARLGSTYAFYCDDPADLDMLGRKLAEIRIRETAEALFRVRQADGLVSIIVRDRSRDLRNVHLYSSNLGVCSFDDLFEERGFIDSGSHHPEGIFVLAGPGIAKGKSVTEPIGPVDVTPTLLAALGLSVARDMDGRIRTELLDQAFLERSPVHYIDTYEDDSLQSSYDLTPDEEEKVEERLRALGYL